MRLYDSLTQEKREFVPRDTGQVSMYVCGPTVYNYVHVGNARPYVFSLVAKRYFESTGFKVTLVENITDIDDRIILRSLEEGRSAQDVAAEFAEAYRQDTDRLGLGRPDIEPYATDHIPEIIDLVARLVEKGHAYQRGSDVYFDVSSFPDYGKLSRQQTAEMRHGVRIMPGEEKDDPLDFALWKGAKAGEPAWDSPWGPGRPGWHIECSAMSLKYLGPGFDIHGGGRDLIFPHHENEIAQSEAALGSPFVRFWTHNGMLTISQEKMSKSVGNVLTLREVLNSHRPEALVTVFLNSHYRSPMEFGEEILEEAERQVDRLSNVFAALRERERGAAATVTSTGGPARAESPAGGDERFWEMVERRQRAFAEDMADDLNTAAALAEVFSLARETNSALSSGTLTPEAARRVRECLTQMVYVLGLSGVCSGEETVPAEVLALAEERQRCRKAKDFARADELRARIAEKGYEVRDTASGFQIARTR